MPPKRMTPDVLQVPESEQGRVGSFIERDGAIAGDLDSFQLIDDDHT